MAGAPAPPQFVPPAQAIQDEFAMYVGANNVATRHWSRTSKDLTDAAPKFLRYTLRQALEHPAILRPSHLDRLKALKTYLQTLDVPLQDCIFDTAAHFRDLFTGAGATLNTYEEPGRLWGSTTKIISSNLLPPYGEVEIICRAHTKLVLLCLMARYPDDLQMQIQMAQGTTTAAMAACDEQIGLKLADTAGLIAGGMSIEQIADFKLKFAGQLAEGAALKNAPEIFKLMATKPAAVQANFLKYALSKDLIASGQIAACRDLTRRSGHVFKFYENN